MNEVTKEWVKYANENKLAYEVLNGLHQKPCSVICYHAAMTAEMMIKACFAEYFPNDAIRETHKMDSFLKALSYKFEIPEKILLDVSELISYVVREKYPHGEDVDESHVRKTIKFSKEIYDWALSRIVENKERRKRL